MTDVHAGSILARAVRDDASPDDTRFELATDSDEGETPPPATAARATSGGGMETLMAEREPVTFRAPAAAPASASKAPAETTTTPPMPQVPAAAKAATTGAPSAAVSTATPKLSFGKRFFNFLFGTPFFKASQLTSALTLIYYGDKYGPALLRDVWHGTKALMHIPEHGLGHDFTRAIDVNYPRVLPSGAPGFAAGIKIPIAAGAPVPGGTIPNDVTVWITRDGHVNVTAADGRVLESHVKHNKIYIKGQTQTGEVKDLQVCALDKKTGRLYVETDKAHEGVISAIPASPQEMLKIGLPVPSLPPTQAAAATATPTTSVESANAALEGASDAGTAEGAAQDMRTSFAAWLQRQGMDYAPRLSKDNRFSIALFADGKGIVRPAGGGASVEVRMDADGFMRDGNGVPLFRMLAGPDFAIVALPYADTLTKAAEHR